MRARDQQHARSGAVAADRGALPARSASASSSCAPTTSRASRPARCGSPWCTPPPTPRSSASSTPTMSCMPDWLKDLVPLFADPTVGLVQAPQDHRDGERSVMHHAMNGEYAGFFDIGMVQRNEYNAIIVHGTMCLVRRAALEAAGGWSSDTICEDTDLGLTMLELGWHAHYTNRRYGHGLLPDSFEAYKKQRHRWAYGGFQIVKKHWRRFLPGAQPAHPRAEARIRARLAQLARRRKPRRRGRHPQPRLGAGRRLPRHRRARPHSDDADPRQLRRVGGAFRDAVPAARAHRQRASCSARCSRPCRCNGRWRARSASA